MRLEEKRREKNEERKRRRYIPHRVVVAVNNLTAAGMKGVGEQPLCDRCRSGGDK